MLSQCHPHPLSTELFWNVTHCGQFSTCLWSYLFCTCSTLISSRVKSCLSFFFVLFLCMFSMSRRMYKVWSLTAFSLLSVCVTVLYLNSIIKTRWRLYEGVTFKSNLLKFVYFRLWRSVHQLWFWVTSVLLLSKVTATPVLQKNGMEIYLLIIYIITHWALLLRIGTFQIN